MSDHDPWAPHTEAASEASKPKAASSGKVPSKATDAVRWIGRGGTDAERQDRAGQVRAVEAARKGGPRKTVVGAVDSFLADR